MFESNPIMSLIQLLIGLHNWIRLKPACLSRVVTANFYGNSLLALTLNTTRHTTWSTVK